MSRKLPNLNQKTATAHFESSEHVSAFQGEELESNISRCASLDASNRGIYWLQTMKLLVGIFAGLSVAANNIAQLPQNFDISKNILFSSCIPGLEKAKPEARKIE